MPPPNRLQDSAFLSLISQLCLGIRKSMSPKFELMTGMTAHLIPCAWPGSLFMDCLGDGRLIKLYQLFRLLGDCLGPTHSSPLSRGRRAHRKPCGFERVTTYLGRKEGKGKEVTQWLQEGRWKKGKQ